MNKYRCKHCKKTIERDSDKYWIKSYCQETDQEVRLIKVQEYLAKDTDTEYILCAAIWYKELPLENEEPLRLRGFSPYNVDKGVVMCGWRHPNCIYQMVGITGLSDHEAGESVQGFLTNKNRFVDRIEGAEIAYAAGQTDELKKRLYSEDLY
jgi:hypothetical protein